MWGKPATILSAVSWGCTYSLAWMLVTRMIIFDLLSGVILVVFFVTAIAASLTASEGKAPPKGGDRG